MTKSELKTGMIVVLANGKEYMVYKNAVYGNSNKERDVIVATDGSNHWNFLCGYNEDMTHQNREWNDFDIIQVIRPFHPYAFIRHVYEKEKREIIWSKKKRYTYAQLKEILGEEFEVVG